MFDEARKRLKTYWESHKDVNANKLLNEEFEKLTLLEFAAIMKR